MKQSNVRKPEHNTNGVKMCHLEGSLCTLIMAMPGLETICSEVIINATILLFSLQRQMEVLKGGQYDTINRLFTYFSTFHDFKC